MATTKKHVAVYLDPAVQQALSDFCEQRGLKSRKGVVFSAGVNTALAEFFGISGIEESSTPSESSSIPDKLSSIPDKSSSIPVAIEVLPGKSDAGNPEELPTVTDSELQSEIGNLTSEILNLNRRLEIVKADRDDRLASYNERGDKIAELVDRNHRREQKANATIEKLTKEKEALKKDFSFEVETREKLERQVQELRSKLATEEARYEELESEIEGLDEKYKELEEKYDETVEWWKQEEIKVRDGEKEIAELRSELSDLQKKSATASEPDAIDLTEKAGELLSFFKSLLPKNTKLPSGTISKIEKILEGER